MTPRPSFHGNIKFRKLKSVCNRFKIEKNASVSVTVYLVFSPSSLEIVILASCDVTPSRVMVGAE